MTFVEARRDLKRRANAIHACYPIFSLEDADLAQLRWTAHKGYARRKSNGKPLNAHTIVMSRMLGRSLVKGEEVDHINGTRLDVRRENLRLVTRQQNCWNLGLRWDNKVGYKGVHFVKNRWRAQLKHNRRMIRLGTYGDPVEAAAAYDAEAKRRFGKFARLNFPEGAPPQ
jgi:hypothetical protein